MIAHGPAADLLGPTLGALVGDVGDVLVLALGVAAMVYVVVFVFRWVAGFLQRDVSPGAARDFDDDVRNGWN